MQMLHMPNQSCPLHGEFPPPRQKSSPVIGSARQRDWQSQESVIVVGNRDAVGSQAFSSPPFGKGRFQAIALPHGDTALNQDLIGVMDDAVHDRLGNRAARVRIGSNACIPALRLVLGAEDHRALAAGLHDFQQVVGLLGRERPDEPLVQD